MENEHNNVLKNRGHNLKHNFGHGKDHAAKLFFLLDMPAFQFHTILELGDEEPGRRGHLWGGGIYFLYMQAALRYALHETRREFLLFAHGEDFVDDDGG
jgi:hypothetical protein